MSLTVGHFKLKTMLDAVVNDICSPKLAPSMMLNCTVISFCDLIYIPILIY